jgi:TPR repeat protein
MWVGVHGMSTPTDSLTDPLAYAPKWAREAAIAERRNAAGEDRVSKRNESPVDAWPTEWSPAARSVDPIVLPPPPSRSPLRVRFAIAGGMAISAAAGAITALFVVGKLPSWGPVAKDASLGVASFETRFIGQDDKTDGASLSAAANKQPRLAEPLRQTDDASPRAAANEEPRLAEPLRGAIADHASSTGTDGASPSAAANDQPPLAEPLRQTDGASPRATASEEPRLAEPLRGAIADHASSTGTDGASPSAAANDQPPLAEPLRQTDGASSSMAANEEPRLAVPLRETDDASPSAAANEEPRLAVPLRGATVEHVTEPSPTPSALNADAIAAFLERAQELVSSGDIAAARVLLLRAAEARDPKAALALAATFDPIILQRTGAYGVVPDVPSAQHWYEKAKEFGSEEASRRLEMLARRQM